MRSQVHDQRAQAIASLRAKTGRTPEENQELMKLVIAYLTELSETPGAELTQAQKHELQQAIASRIAFLTDKGENRTATEDEQLLAVIRLRIEEIESGRTGLTTEQRIELNSLNASQDVLRATVARRIAVLKRRIGRTLAETQDLRALTIAHLMDLRQLTPEQERELQQVIASRFAFLTDRGENRTPTEDAQLLAVIRLRIEEIRSGTSELSTEQRVELEALNATQDELQATIAARIDVLKRKTGRTLEEI